MTNKPQEISLVKIAYKIWKHRLLAIIVALVVALAATTIIYFYSRSRQTVSNSYTYQFVNEYTNKYPDGTPFDFRLVTDENFLTDVKARNEAFKNISIRELLTNERFVVSNAAIRSTTNPEISLNTYTITLPSSVFNHDIELLEFFILEIHNQVIEIAMKKNDFFNVTNYFSDLDQLENLTYVDIFTLLREQYESLQSKYTNFISQYGDIVADNQHFSIYRDQLRFWYEDTLLINLLEAQMLERGYYQNQAESKRIASIGIISNERRIEYNQNLIEALYNDYKKFNEVPGSQPNFGDATLIHETIISLNNEIVGYQRMTEFYTKIINDTMAGDSDYDAFKAAIINGATKLSQAADDYNRLSGEYINSQTRYTIVGNRRFMINKPMGLVISIMISVLVGGFVGVSAALIKDAFIESKQSLANEN